MLDGYHVRDSAPNTNVMQAPGLITGVKTIADRLKSAREEAGLSQEDVAKAAGVAQGTIGNIESGARKNPRELLAIARAVGVTPDWLKTGKGPRSRQASIAAAEPQPAYGAAEPPSPRGNFDDRHTISDSDWALLQDIKDAMESPKLARRIDELRAELAELKTFAESQYRKRLEAAQETGGNAGGMSAFGDLDEAAPPPAAKKTGGRK